MFKYIFLGILAAVAYFVFVFEMQLTNQMIGNTFIGGISACLVVFLFFKFGLHYKIASLNRFSTAFYYAVFEYKKVQTTPSDLDFVDSVREQAEVALAANFDPTLSASQLAIPISLYSGNDSYLEELRAKIKASTASIALLQPEVDARPGLEATRSYLERTLRDDVKILPNETEVANFFYTTDRIEREAKVDPGISRIKLHRQVECLLRLPQACVARRHRSLAGSPVSA